MPENLVPLYQKLAHLIELKDLSVCPVSSQTIEVRMGKNPNGLHLSPVTGTDEVHIAAVTLSGQAAPSSTQLGTAAQPLHTSPQAAGTTKLSCLAGLVCSRLDIK